MYTNSQERPPKYLNAPCVGIWSGLIGKLAPTAEKIYTRLFSSSIQKRYVNLLLRKYYLMLCP